jgi:hypothetical protein
MSTPPAASQEVPPTVEPEQLPPPVEPNQLPPPVELQEVPLPVEIQELIKNQCWYRNPMSDLTYDVKLQDIVGKLHLYRRTMNACGHDTKDLEDSIARLQAAIQDLRHVNEWMYGQFKQNPFPFLKGTAEGAMQVEEAAEVTNTVLYKGYELEGAAGHM